MSNAAVNPESDASDEALRSFTAADWNREGATVSAARHRLGLLVEMMAG